MCLFNVKGQMKPSVWAIMFQNHTSYCLWLHVPGRQAPAQRYVTPGGIRRWPFQGGNPIVSPYLCMFLCLLCLSCFTVMLFNIHVPPFCFLFGLCVFVGRRSLRMLYHLHDLLFTLVRLSAPRKRKSWAPVLFIYALYFYKVGHIAFIHLGITVLVLIKLKKIAVALRLRCGYCKLFFWHYFIIFR